MISNNRSAFVQAFVIIALTALVVQVGNILALATTPTPNQVQFSLTQATALIQQPGLSATLEIPVRHQTREPSGRRETVLEALLAERLGVEPDRVRVVLFEDSRILFQGSNGSGAETAEAPQHPPNEISELDLITPEMAASLESVPLPYMNAAFLTDEGHWIVTGAPDAFWADWRFRLALTFLATLVLLTPIAWWVARHMTHPLRKLAKQVLANTPDAAAGGADGPREVQALALAIEDLRSRLEAQLADRERMAAAMAHDLRTPLTSLRIRAEQAPETTRKRMVEDIERMQSMISEIIDYAHARHEKEQIDLDLVELIRSCIEETKLLASVKMGSSPLTLRSRVDPVALRRAINNLIRNAQQYGSNAEVSLHPQSGKLEIWVEDDGPGIADEDKTRLIEPFQRGEQSRNRKTGGAGLGLTIARDTAMDHGGHLRLEDRPDGGLRAVLEIPLGT